MAMPTDIPASQAPSYIIYRDVPAGDLYDPTAPLAFFPPKDSDELFDALRAKYPHLKSHSERMRDATIEFLLEERQAESVSATVSPTMPSLYDSMADTSPWQQSWPSASMTTLSSPDMTNFATPAFDSPKPNHPQMARQQSSAATPSESQTPAIDQMTSVFSLSTSEQPKQRVRRKMTEAEKVEYRKRRIVKACDKCSKRKRKCIHNQPEMDGLKSANDKAQSKVTKPRTNTAKVPQHAEVSFPSFDFSAADPSEMFTADGLAGGYEDFTLMFDPTPDFSFDETPAFDMSQSFTPVDDFRQYTQHIDNNNAKPTWHQSHMQDWAMGSTGMNSFSSYAESTEAADNFTDLVAPYASQAYETSQSRRRCDLRTGQFASLQTHSTSSSSTDVLDNRFQRTSSSSTHSSPHGASIPQSPTHTAHVHEMQAPQGFVHVDDGVLWSGGSIVRGGSTEDSRNISHGSAPLSANATSSSQLLSDTALRHILATTAGANRSAASDGAQSAAARHRLRSAGVIDSALQSELSSTSATSSSNVPKMGTATALEGRPAASSSSTSLLRNASNSSNAASVPVTSSMLLTRSSPTQGETTLRAPVPVQTIGQTPAALQLQSTRAASALLAQPSPFDDNSSSALARSTELFRLRHRLATSLGNTAPAAIHTTSSNSLATQANGGSRLGNATDRLATAALQASSAGKRSLATAPARTEASNKTGFNGARKIFTEVETNRNRDHYGRTSTVFAESNAVQYLDHSSSGSSSMATPSNKLGQTLRTVFTVVALGALLLLVSARLHPTVLTLALIAPASASVISCHRPWPSTMRSKASSALTSMQRKAPSSPMGHALLRSVLV